MNFRKPSLTLLVAALALVPAAALAGGTAKSAGKSTASKSATTTTTVTSAPTTGATTTPAGDAKAAMMAEMMKEGAPGPMHAALKGQEGTWNATVTSWPPTGGEPTTTTGTETRNMILGGRFLESKFTGTYMGQPYEGYGLTGYDNKSQKVTWVWADNMSTRAMDLTGTMTPDGKTINCTGSIDGMDGKPMGIRAELKFDTDTQMTYTMYASANGTDTKMVQIVYTKAAGTADAQSK